MRSQSIKRIRRTCQTFLIVLTVSTIVYSAPVFAADSANEKFARRQLRQMLDDRSDMENVFPHDSPIVRWVLSRYAGKEKGDRVFWDCREPFSGQVAEHIHPFESYPSLIRISSTKYCTGLDKWLMLVFEFHNLEAYRELDSDLRKVMDGDLDSNEFAMNCVRREFLAMRRTVEFLRENSVADRVQSVDRVSIEILACPKSFDDFLSTIGKNHWKGGHDPLHYFKEYADRIVENVKTKVPFDNKGARNPLDLK